MAVNWEQVNAKLPFARNKAAFSKRKDMWTAIDVNGNGFLSLAEVTKVTKNTKTFPSVGHTENSQMNPRECGT